MRLKNLRVIIACLLALLACSGVLLAKNKADKYYKQGQAAEQKKDWDTALDLYLKALNLKPNDAEYMIAMRRARFQSGEIHIAAGQKLRAQGKLPEAMAEFQKGLIADPGSSIAMQEIKRTNVMMQHPSKQGEEGMTPADRARQSAEKRLDSILQPPELKPVLRTIGPLKINNQPTKILYETVGKVAGVNVLFDSQYNAPNHNFNLELTRPTSPEQVFDYLAVMTHTFWKPISGGAIFVTEDNPTKHRDYDDEVLKVFYVTNVTSAQEFQEIATAIRSVADIRRVFTYTAQHALVVRGTVDAVELAEKMVHDLDKPKAEVVVDMIIMQTNSDHAKQLAATIVNASTGNPGGLNIPFAFSPVNPVQTTTTGLGASGATGITGVTGATGTPGALIGLNQLGHLSTQDFATTLPGGLLNLLVTDTSTNVLNSPTLRVSDGMKAELKIGQRIPYATGSFQPGVGTVGVSPLVSTQFNYIDTGVNVLIQPQVHSDSELTLHVEVDVSLVVSYQNLGGLPQPVIGQNKNTADVRLREGEVTILGGLNQASDTKTVNGIPGLVNIPVLGGTVFGGTNTDKSKSELMIAMIPHIVRSPDFTEENLRGVYVGNDANIKLMYASDEGETAPAAAEAAKPNPAAPAAAPTPAPAPVNVAPPAPPSAAPKPENAHIAFSPATVVAAPGSNFALTVQLENANDLFSAAPIKVKYDPAQLRLNEMTPGDLFTRDGGKVMSVKEIRNDNGEATLTVARLPGSSGVTGSGAVAVLNFVAVAKGASTVKVQETTFKNSKGEAVHVTLGEVNVKVQ
ncbi:MAG TPA: cohesin domain-containing protein [Bryobacteraceae bacterium]|nr:cohesin domain-containing protein [Bryobacteraceae bacterium]